MKITQILCLALILVVTYQTGLQNTSTTCTPGQEADGFNNIFVGGSEQCIDVTCFDQLPYFSSDIDQSTLISFTSEFQNTEVTLSSLTAFCPSTNANCLSPSCIEFSVSYYDSTPIVATNEGNLLDSFIFDLPLATLQDSSKCIFNSDQREYTCTIYVEYSISGMTGAGLNRQEVQFKILLETRGQVSASLGAGAVPVECVGGTGSCEGGDDGSGDITFITTCAAPISSVEGNVGFSLEYLQNASSQYYYKFFIEYNNPYVHNPDCLDQVVTFNDKVIETGETEFDQWTFDQPSMKSSYSISKENMETYGCDKTTNDDGSFTYDCTLKVEFFLKDTTSLQYTYMSNQQVTVSADETTLNSLGVEDIVLKNLEQELFICDNLACDNQLEPPFSYFLNETIYVKQRMNSVSYLTKYLDIQSVKIGQKRVNIIEKDSSVAGNVRYGFRASEVSSVEQQLEVISKVKDVAPSTRLLSVVPTTTTTFAIKSDIQITELKEVPPPPPPTQPPTEPVNPEGPSKKEDDDDNTALIIIIILVSILLLVGIAIGVFKFLQNKGGNEEVKIVPESTERNNCKTNANETLIEVEGNQNSQQDDEEYITKRGQTEENNVQNDQQDVNTVTEDNNNEQA